MLENDNQRLQLFEETNEKNERTGVEGKTEVSNTNQTMYDIFETHARGLAAFTLEIFEDVTVGVTDTLDSVVVAVSESRDRIALNDAVDDILTKIDQELSNFNPDDIKDDDSNPDDIYHKFTDRAMKEYDTKCNLLGIKNNSPESQGAIRRRILCRHMEMRKDLFVQKWTELLMKRSAYANAAKRVETNEEHLKVNSETPLAVETVQKFELETFSSVFEKKLKELQRQLPMNREALLFRFECMYMSLTACDLADVNREDLKTSIIDKKQDFLELNTALVMELLVSTSKSFGYEANIKFDDVVMI